VCLAVFSIVAMGCSDNAFLGSGGEGGSDDGAYGSESNPAYVDMSQFEQGCESGAECILVNPQACMECNTNCNQTEGLRSKELPAFEEAKAAIECEAESSKGCNNDCGPMRPACLESQCVPLRDLDMAPKSCTEDSDCLALDSLFLDQCWPDSCPDMAVNKAEWEIAVGVDCDDQTRGDTAIPGDCDTGIVPRCAQGECVLSDQ
jgi:hypothetical protein